MTRTLQRGFSLLEVLVAFVILALVGTMLSGLYSGSLRNASAAEEWSKATLLAQGQLAAAAATVPLVAASNSGTSEDGRYSWATKVEPYTPPGTADPLTTATQNTAMQLMRVTVDVKFPGPTGAERSISLATVKLVRRALLQ
ncbi:MAG: prepilin-type N-terminal cleavage/methylation domain-containing protein [Proteobacteria bacterium]|nr:prepilin-type N-terminal cleavage/methylation domain-containing protein [Pseudomonadota bacterium]